MTRLVDAWRALKSEQRLAGVAAFALLVTMFFPWYGLQSLNRKTGAIYSHNINAFGDVSFVEAAIFLVAAGVMTMLFARAEGRHFRLPGGDGTITIAHEDGPDKLTVVQTLKTEPRAKTMALDPRSKTSPARM